VSRLGRAGILLFVGILTARLIWSGGFGWFVQQRMRIPLILAAAILLIFGAYELFSWARAEDDDNQNHDDHDHGEDHDRDGDHEHEHAHAHSHSAGPAVGWLLALPLLVLISVAPTALGALAASRVDAYVPDETTRSFDPLPESEPVVMRVIEFIDRASWDPDRSLEGRTVRLEGLVVNDESVPDGFKLTRFMVSCCAADGIPLQVSVHGVDQALDDDTWVEVDLVWRPPEVPYQSQEGVWVIEADAVSITPIIGVPKDPYESPY
jgi:uncharacterized repeat protein (TIGR03943 family)